MGPERTIEPLSHRHRQFEEGPKIRGSIGANADPKSLYRIPWPSGIPLEGGQLGHYAQSEALDRGNTASWLDLCGIHHEVFRNQFNG